MIQKSYGIESMNVRCECGKDTTVWFVCKITTTIDNKVDIHVQYQGPYPSLEYAQKEIAALKDIDAFYDGRVIQ